MMHDDQAASLRQSLQASAGTRGHLSAVAHLLSDIPSRGDIEWDDLLAVPSWALLQDDAALTVETLSIGAWAHLDQIRRCIDGRLLAHVAGLLGQQELDRIMAAPPLRDDEGSLMGGLASPLSGLGATELRQRLMHIGQWLMLISVSRRRVRKAVAQALWPHIPHLHKDQVPEEVHHSLATAVMRARCGDVNRQVAS